MKGVEIIDSDRLHKYIEESSISLTKAYIKAPEVLKVGDSIVGTLGNFSVSIGKAKSKKTFNVSAIVAAAIANDKVLNYEACFPEDKHKVLYIDTEQGQIHCQKVLKRIAMLLNLPDGIDPPNLTMLALRKYVPQERIKIIESCIECTPCLGLVIIDGVRDLLYDINNAIEATEVSSLLMRWTFDKKIHIHTILHQNKGDDNARGHIGTELNNKAESIIQVSVNTEDKSISIVESLHSRDIDFKPFAFRINEDALPELVGNFEIRKKKVGRPAKKVFDPYSDIQESVHRNALSIAFENGCLENYQDLTDGITKGYLSQGEKMNYKKAVKIARFLRDKQMIILEDEGYRYNPDFQY